MSSPALDPASGSAQWFATTHWSVVLAAKEGDSSGAAGALEKLCRTYWPPLPAKRAARYARIVAEAIHYAHEQGVLHRDLKPSNILIDENDQPRITDFGLAKRARGDFGLTVTGQLLGSPNFMPPEQTSGKSGKVGPASDVYGLGAIVYHLLTGRPPFQAERIEDVLRQLHEVDPVDPRLLNPSIPRDLETICLKCLEKDPAKRYQSARELADELGRFLSSEPIHARPIGRVWRMWRWCKRKPALAASLGGLAIVFSLGFGGVAWQSTARRKALVETSRTLYAAQMNVVQKAWEDGNIIGAQSLLRAVIPRPGEMDLRGFEWRYLWKHCRDESMVTIKDDQPAGVQSVAVSLDGAMIAFGGSGMLGRTWRFDTGELQPPFKREPDHIRSLIFSPDSSRIVCGNAQGSVKIWDARSGELLATLQGFSGAIERVHVSPDGLLVAAAEAPTGTVRVFNLETREEVAVIPGSPHDRPAVAFSPNGRTLAFTRGDRTVGLWNVFRKTEERTLASTNSGLSVYLAFSPDGRWLAAAGTDRVVRLWDLTSDREPDLLKGHKAWVTSVAFSPDGSRLATSCIDNTIKLWDAASRSELRTFRGHAQWVGNVVFTPDGLKLISGSDDQTVKIWDLAARRPKDTLSATPDMMRPINITPLGPTRFSPNGELLVTANRDNEIVLWNVLTEGAIARLPGHSGAVRNVAFSPEGHLLASVSDDRTVGLWSIAERRQLAVLQDHTAPVGVVAFSHDGGLLASAGEDRTVRVWDVASRQLVATLPGHTAKVLELAFLHGAGRLISGGEDGTRVWNIRQQEQTSHIPGTAPIPGMRNFCAVVPSPDERTMICFTNALAGLLWDVVREKPRATLACPRIVRQMAYSADSSLIAAGSDDDIIRIWDTATGKLLHTLAGHGGWVTWVAFAPDGRTLASASNDGTVKLWSLVSFKEVAALGPVGAWSTVTFSPDGNTLAARTASDGQIHLWHAPTFKEIETAIATGAAKATVDSR